MIKKRNSITLSILLFLALILVSCGSKEQHYIEKVLDSMVKSNSPQEIEKAKAFTTDSLDFSQLDSLGVKTDYINTWIGLYLNKNEDSSISSDSKTLIERLSKESPQELESLIKIIANNDKLFDKYPNISASIVAYAYGIDVPAEEQSEIANRLLTLTRLPGKKAPQIQGLQPLEGVNSTIVLFYDGSCGICKHILEDLAAHYDQLTAKGVRIVTISADGSKETFEQNIEKYPWTDKLCDYQSFNSINFKNFGIAATPTMFVIDKNGIVVDQFSSLVETGLINPVN